MFGMKKLKGLALASILALSCGLMAGCGSDAPEQKADQQTYKIGVVQLVEHAALDAANKGFVDALADRGFKDNVEIDQQNAQADQSNLQNIGQRFVNNKVDLICAIATPAAQTVANMTKDIPIVATAVTDYVSAKLVQDNEKPGTNVTGTTDMNPVAEQLDLLLKLIPDAKTVGVIYCSSEVNSQLQIDIFKKAAEAKGIKIEEATISNVNDIQQAAQGIAGKVQAIYVPTDNVIASAIPTLTKITDAAKIPVICGEENMVKAGGLATLGIDYYKLGYQAGEMAADILEGKSKPADMAIQSLKDMKTVLNTEKFELLGITIPEDLASSAEKVTTDK